MKKPQMALVQPRHCWPFSNLDKVICYLPSDHFVFDRDCALGLLIIPNGQTTNVGSQLVRFPDFPSGREATEAWLWLSLPLLS